MKKLKKKKLKKKVFSLGDKACLSIINTGIARYQEHYESKEKIFLSIWADWKKVYINYTRSGDFGHGVIINMPYNEICYKCKHRFLHAGRRPCSELMYEEDEYAKSR